MYCIVLDRQPRVPILSEKSSGASNTIDTKNTTKGFTLVHSSALANPKIEQSNCLFSLVDIDPFIENQSFFLICSNR